MSEFEKLPQIIYEQVLCLSFSPILLSNKNLQYLDLHGRRYRTAGRVDDDLSRLDEAQLRGTHPSAPTRSTHVRPFRSELGFVLGGKYIALFRPRQIDHRANLHMYRRRRRRRWFLVVGGV